MNKTIIVLLLVFNYCCTLKAQSIDELLKSRQIEICECFKEIDYIENEFDFQMKFDSCVNISEEDSLFIEKNLTLEEFVEEMYNSISEECSYIQKLADENILDMQNEANSKFSISDNKKYNNLIGTYSLLGGHLMLLENNMYFIAYFGGFEVGNWKVVKDKYLDLIPIRTKYPFVIYGRKNTELSSKTRISFKGNKIHNNNNYIHYGKLNENSEEFFPIFNDDANCFSNSYIKTIPKKKEELSLVHLPYGKSENKATVYTFINTEAFNEFIVFENINFYFKQEPRRAKIVEGGLDFGWDEISEREPLPERDSEEFKFIDEIVTDFPKILEPDLKYYNSDFIKYKGEPNEIKLEFIKLNQVEVSKQTISINNTPLFIERCD